MLYPERLTEIQFHNLTSKHCDYTTTIQRTHVYEQLASTEAVKQEIRRIRRKMLEVQACTDAYEDMRNEGWLD